MDLKQSFNLNIKILRVLGLWPTDQSNVFYKIYGWVLLIGFDLTHCLSQIIYIILNFNNYSTVFFTASVLLISACSCPKCYLYLNNAHLIKDIINYLDIPEFKPQGGFKVFGDILGFWKKLGKIYMAWGFVSLSFWIFTPIIFTDQALPNQAWYFFEIDHSPNFQIIFTFQAIALMYIAIASINSDIFFAGLIAHIAIQCRILSNNLINMEKYTRTNNKYKNLKFDEALYRRFKECIKHHKLILIFSEQVSFLINNIVFTQMIISLLSYSTILYNIILSPMSSAKFVVCVVFLPATLLQLLIVCWEGSFVIDESSKIARAAFHCGWENGSPTMKKDLILFMARTQKPIVIKLLNFFELSLNTFTSVLQKSYSYFAVLQQTTEN